MSRPWVRSAQQRSAYVIERDRDYAIRRVGCPWCGVGPGVSCDGLLLMGWSHAGRYRAGVDAGLVPALPGLSTSGSGTGGSGGSSGNSGGGAGTGPRSEPPPTRPSRFAPAGLVVVAAGADALASCSGGSGG